MAWLPSSGLISVIYLAIIALICRWLFKLWINILQLPPGPWGIPIVGYLPWLSNKAYLDFIEIGKKYGGLFSIKLGNETVVVLNDWPTIKACLVDKSKTFSGRPFNIMVNTFGNRKDITFADGPVWQKQRNLTIKCMKNAGVGKSAIQIYILEMVDQIMDFLKQSDGKAVFLNTIIANSVFAFTWKLISSIELAENADEMKKITKHFRIILNALRSDNPVTYFPILRFCPPNGFGYWKYQKSLKKYHWFLRRVLDKYKEQSSPKYGVVDYYIEEIKQNDSKNPPYNADYLIGVMADLMVATGDTSIASTLWGFLYLVLYPEVQQKVQSELDKVIGRERLPTIEDMPRLPYLNAVTMEIYRMSSIVTLSIPHSTLEKVQVNDCVIPKRTTCIINLYAVHHDPKLWDEPELFKPERFLNEDNEVQSFPYLIPFSVGARQCIGQSLGDVELRLIFSCILHRFTLSLPENMPKPSLESTAEVSIKPLPYSVYVKCRKS
ncbi:Cytochrome P450 2 sub R member 1 [Chamberlinius hualienensis]|uniref:Cytochrome P450 3201C1 n=1 Tax=Chamberlinius hualienensis TaxID=1551368 RepID=A0A1J1DVN7_9MYRI|nr:cytochrome P450 3201C1 [Chamberlinius hualienensis]